MTIEELKGLLGIQDISKDAILEFALNRAVNTAKGYCNINEVPVQLETTVLSMAVDIYRAGGYGAEEIPTGAVESVKRGDITTSFKTVAAIDEKGLITKYEKELRPYRRLGW